MCLAVIDIAFNFCRKKIKVKINDEEKSIIMQALLEKRNKQLKENRPTEPVNELLEKIIKK